MKKLLPWLVGLGLFACAFLFADGALDIPDSDPLSVLLALVQNAKTLAPLSIASLVIMFIVQVFKKLFPNFLYTRFVVVIGGVIYGVIHQLLTGLSLVNSLAFILITSGGAVAIYELFVKPASGAVVSVVQKIQGQD